MPPKKNKKVLLNNSEDNSTILSNQGQDQEDQSDLEDKLVECLSDSFEKFGVSLNKS